MTLIANKTLRDGFLTVALPGTAVSPALVARNGWEADVDEIADPEETVPTVKAARRGKKSAVAE
jgi:hypothetical protein